VGKPFLRVADFLTFAQMKIQTDTIKSAREQLLAGADTITGAHFVILESVIFVQV
jgi:hypothetical protein